MAGDRQTIAQRDPIVTPADAAELIVRDGSQPIGSRNRRWSLTNVLAWIRAKFAATPVTILEGGTGDTTASGARTNLGLGTAALADVQTSITDTTADRLMKVGAFGIGGLDQPTALASLNVALATGVYRATGAVGGTTGNPDPLGWQASVFIQNSLSQRSSAVYIRTGSTSGRGIWVGERSASTSPFQWVELYHSGNYPSDTGWTTTTTLLNGWTGTVQYIKRAGMVTVQFSGLNGSSKTGDACLNLPAAYRSDIQIEGVAKNSLSQAIRFVAQPGGNLVVVSGDTSLSGSITYPVIT